MRETIVNTFNELVLDNPDIPVSKILESILKETENHLDTLSDADILDVLTEVQAELNLNQHYIK